MKTAGAPPAALGRASGPEPESALPPRTKPRILIATTVPETVMSILRDQPRFLSKHFDVCLATSPGDELAAVAQREGVTVHTVPMARGIHPFRDFLSIVRMMGLLREIRPDVVHSYTPKAGLVLMVAAWIHNVPIRIHTFTGLIFPTQRGLRRRLLIWVDGLICRCATRVVPEGNGVRRDLLRFGVTSKKLKVIGHGNIAGVDTDVFSSIDGMDPGQVLAAGAGIRPEDFVYCFVGRLHRDKGLRELVIAFQKLPGKPHLVLVGAVDSSNPVDPETLAALKFHPRVHFWGYQEDVRPALHRADVVVLPSYREGFPNVLLEAGSMGRPVIATDVNGSNEIVEDGFNGWLVPARDAKALHRAMASALATPREALRRLGANARSRVRERFERQHHWTRLLEFYRQQLAQPLC